MSRRQSCAVCGSTRPPLLRRVLPDLTISICSECGFVAGDFPAAPRGPSDYDQIDMAHYEASIGAMRRDEAVAHVEMVERQRPAAKTWFDVGCGTGSLLREAARAGYTVSGAEPDETARSLVSANLPGAHIGKWFEDGSAPDGSQGVISMLDVLEHFEPARLGDMARLVRSKLVTKGYWLIKVPSTEGIFYLTANAAARIVPRAAGPVIRRLWLMKNASPHRVYFRADTLARFLSRYGFEPMNVCYSGAIPAGTILSRLRVDDTIPKWLTIPLTPMVAALNLAEHLRGRSDSLVMLARKTGA